MVDRTADTFDADLARIEEIGRAHDVSSPYDSGTCAARDYNKAREHREFLLGFIDKLWRKYSRTLQKLDDRVAERPSVEQFIERLKSAGWTARYDAQWEGVTKLHGELFPGHGNATTDADRQVSARTAGDVPASDGDSACPAVPSSTVTAQPMQLFDVLQSECGSSIAERLVEAICKAGLRVETTATSGEN